MSTGISEIHICDTGKTFFVGAAARIEASALLRSISFLKKSMRPRLLAKSTQGSLSTRVVFGYTSTHQMCTENKNKSKQNTTLCILMGQCVLLSDLFWKMPGFQYSVVGMSHVCPFPVAREYSVCSWHRSPHVARETASMSAGVVARREQAYHASEWSSDALQPSC